jgi:RNA polymerase sigma-70 factor, ECF subfamily
VTRRVPAVDLPDTMLIRRFIDGDEAAFRMLYERHTPRLKMMVRRVLGRRSQDTDDVVQDTWLAGCRGIHTYRGDAKFASWLLAIGARTAYASLSRRESNEDELMEDVADPRVDGHATVIDLERALTELSDAQRTVVVLHDIEGFTHEEIGQQLGMATGTSKATLSRARQSLRMALTNGASNAAR